MKEHDRLGFPLYIEGNEDPVGKVIEYKEVPMVAAMGNINLLATPAQTPEPPCSVLHVTAVKEPAPDSVEL